jgi:hypothetical protein
LENRIQITPILYWKNSVNYILTQERGDVFGIYSALKHQKNNYTAEVISSKASIYKIAKAHLLLYFGGSSGTLPNTLKGLDTVQQNSLRDKIEFLSSPSLENIDSISRFDFKRFKEDSSIESKILVDESQITNFLKDAWKELENMESKVANFKTAMLKGPAAKNDISSNLLTKLKEKEKEPDSKILIT